MRQTTAFAGTAAVLALLTGCSGRGGGWLPPALGFADRATVGLSFGCDTGRLHLQLDYTDHGASFLGPEPFDIHGTADIIPTDLEAALCAGNEPPPGGQQIVILGQYRVTSTPAPTGLRGQCLTEPACRFQVTVRDNDADGQPSTGDYFEILLSTVDTLTSDLPPATVVYTRGGILAGGNLTVS
jgi:hypothetical protein